MNSFFILNVILIFINAEIIFSWKCGSDKLTIRPKPLNLTTQKITKNSELTSSSYTPISIGYDFTTLQKPLSMSLSIFENVKSLLQETREEFSKILQIRHKNINLTNYLEDIIDICEIYTIGENYPEFLIKDDIIIFPKFYDLDDGILASAAPCLIDNNLRPIAGVLFINSELNFEMENTKYYLKNLLFHEITHILAFHPFFFKHLNMSIVSGSKSYINSPIALSKAREHFNCSSLSLIPLENQGGSGSIGAHWESRYMLGDYMVSTDFPDSTTSDITLGLFEDTGFYKVNYYSGGLFKFGKNKGCAFFNKKCIENEKANFEEFCHIKNEAKCSSSRSLKTSCYLIDYYASLPKDYQYFSNPNRGGFFAADYCPVPLEIYYENDHFPNHCQFGKSYLPNEYGENISKESLCFMSSLLPENSASITSLIPICYSVECDLSTKNIIVKIGSKRIFCPSIGGIIYNPSGFKGSIECPKYNDICSSNNNTIICNDMYNCFTELAKRDKYDYKTSYFDYSGNTISLYDDYIDVIMLNESFIKLNFTLLIIYLFFF